MQNAIDDPFDRDGLRAKFLVHTGKAYRAVPCIEKPCLLDIGCGSGVPTLELARLSDGMVIGIDVDEGQLTLFNQSVRKAGLQHRVAAVRCSMMHLPFSDNAFDIIWAEGSIAAVGFQEGLKRWRCQIKDGGFVVLHDNVDNITGKLKWVNECGYRLIDHFIISKDVWWETYYKPLQEKIDMMKRNTNKNAESEKTIHSLQHEIGQFHSNPAYHGSVFFIMQKENPND
jgi:cyclopropane fatty-acyl-phospholipid synthase-like methyltransferase